jgi:putative DNA primase/helicase
MIFNRTSTKERARGRWREILPRIGIDHRYLTGRNCACPVCGGTDRFRFIDRKDRDGMWVCNQCQIKPRPALDLVMAFTGKPFREAARMVDDIIGGAEPLPPSPPAPRAPIGGDTSYAKSVWDRGVPVQYGDAVDLYLNARNVGLEEYPASLRCSPLEPYHDDGTLIRLPAMLAIVHANGKPAAVHRTYLATDDSGKADVPVPRKVAGQHGPGPAIRLTPPAASMGVAEGIETALSASKLFGIPTWSTLCAGGIENFDLPPECERLTVFADNDRNHRGQDAAEALARRLNIPVKIKIPRCPGTDWNDVLMGNA